MADRRRRSAWGGLLLALALPAAAEGPPLKLTDRTPHDLAMRVETTLARDLVTVLEGGTEAPEALRRLRASPIVGKALEAEKNSPEQFFGRLVGATAGVTDRIFTPLAASTGPLRALLDAFDVDGKPAASILGKRIALLLPPEPALKVRMTVVPFFGISAFREIVPVRDGDDLWLFADLALVLEGGATPSPKRETILKSLRGAAAEGWRALFDAGGRGKGWEEPKAPGFTALLRQTVLEGPLTLFLVPDDFFPLDVVLAEPIARAFDRWNRAVALLTDPKRGDRDRAAVLVEGRRGEFWGRFPAVAGLQMSDALLRLAGREAFLAALAAGPREVASLYVAATKKERLPQIGREARRELEAARTGDGEKAVSGPGVTGRE